MVVAIGNTNLIINNSKYSYPALMKNPCFILLLSILFLSGCSSLSISPQPTVTIISISPQSTPTLESTATHQILTTATSTTGTFTKPFIPTSSPISPTITPIPDREKRNTATKNIIPSQETNISDKILFFEVEYFQLEGIPPFPSPYLTMVSDDRHWVDMTDPNRFRFERYYRTQSQERKEGFERIEIGTGTGGIMEECQFYEGKEDCSQKSITVSITFDDWLKNYDSVAARYLDNRNNPGSIEGYEYKGIQKDELWGNAYVFERNTT